MARKTSTKDTTAKAVKRKRYDDDEMDDLVDDVWTAERCAADDALRQSDDAPLVLAASWDGLRPQTERLARFLKERYPSGFVGIEVGFWPPRVPEDGVFDRIYMGNGWVVSLCYDAWEPGTLEFINATAPGVGMDETYEYIGDEEAEYDSFNHSLPMPEDAWADFVAYFDRNFSRPGEQVRLDPEDDPYASGEKIVPFRKP